jgi:hypothetical protein
LSIHRRSPQHIKTIPKLLRSGSDRGRGISRFCEAFRTLVILEQVSVCIRWFGIRIIEQEPYEARVIDSHLSTARDSLGDGYQPDPDLTHLPRR